jgi:O-antigen/teichoic acid export membrane protein
MDHKESSTGSLGDRTVRGALWMTTQTIALKFISIASQLVLARLLLEEHFGVYGIALTVTSLFQSVQHFGLREIICRRQQKFHEIWKCCFWLSAVGGLATALLLIISSPLICAAYQVPSLKPLLYWSAASLLLSNLEIVPLLRLELRLEFGWIARLVFATNLIQTLGTIWLAWSGFGALSLVLPPTITALVRVPVLWVVAGLANPFPATLVGAVAILHDSKWILLTSAACAVTNVGDYGILGALKGTTLLGVYLFAFRLSAQSSSLIAASVGRVALPALSSLGDDPDRQLVAGLKVMQTLAVPMMFVCGLQAVLAKPLVQALFPERWLPAVVPVQLLSLGWAIRGSLSLDWILFQAQGRFRMCCLLTIGWAAMFCFLIFVGAQLGGAAGTAVAVLIYSCVQPVTNLMLLYRLCSKPPLCVVKALTAPFCCSLVTLLLAYIWCSISSLSPWQLLLLVPVVTTPLYLLLIRRFVPGAWQSLSRVMPKFG